MRAMMVAGAAALMAVGLWGCGNPAATPDRESASVSSDRDGGPERSSSRRYARDNDSGERGSRSGRSQRASTALPGGGRWAASRNRSAQEAAQRQFARNGADFGAADVNAYVQQAVAFVGSPPAGVLTATRRNGDQLFYDPRGNVFVVADRDGAPRTMFKPREGMSYWQEQQQRITSGGEGRSRGREQARAQDASSENG